MKYKKVLLVSTNADLSGAPLHVKRLAFDLRDAGWEVAAVFGEHGEVQNELSRQGVDTHVINTLRSNFNILQDIRSLIALRKIIKKTKPDLLHAHSSKAGMIGRLAASTRKLPSIYTVHGWGFGAGRRRTVSLFVKTAEILLKKKTTHFIAVSECDRKIGIEEIGLDPALVTTIHNGIEDDDHRAVPRSSKIVVMVARHDRQKDYETLLRAINGLDCELWCIGRGTDSEAFRDTAARLSPRNLEKIQFFGAQSNVSELISKCGIFVLSTHFEGLPLAIIEAMRSGLPVVASDVGGISEMVSDGINGFLVPAGDVQSLEARIQSLLTDATKRHAMGQAGRTRYLDAFSSSRMLSQTLKVYASCLAE